MPADMSATLVTHRAAAATIPAVITAAVVINSSIITSRTRPVITRPVITRPAVMLLMELPTRPAADALKPVAHQAHQAHPDNPASEETMVSPEDPVNPETRDKMPLHAFSTMFATRAQLAQLVPLVPLDQPVNPDRMDNLVAKETQARTDSPVLKDQPVTQERTDKMVRMAPQETMVPLVSAALVNPAPRAHPDNPVNPERTDNPAVKEVDLLPDQLAQLAHLVNPVILVKMVDTDSLENPAAEQRTAVTALVPVNLTVALISPEPHEPLVAVTMPRADTNNNNNITNNNITNNRATTLAAMFNKPATTNNPIMLLPINRATQPVDTPVADTTGTAACNAWCSARCNASIVLSRLCHGSKVTSKRIPATLT